jgi:hypothetical protein
LLKLNANKVFPVTECTQEISDFPVIKRRQVQAEFSGGDITSGGGA